MDRGNLLGAGTVRLSAWEMEEFDKEYVKVPGRSIYRKSNRQIKEIWM